MSEREAPRVASEVGRLRRVVVHRPDLELKRLTPANKGALLFDELVWVGRAQAEHDAFAQILADHGVEVLAFAELLADVLADEGARDGIVTAVATPGTCGPQLVDRVRGHLRDMSLDDLATHLIGGLTVEEVPGAGDGLVGALLGPQAFLLPPLPNTVFTRDPTAWVGDGVIRSPMNKRARRAEALLWAAVLNHHPKVGGGRATTWLGGQPGDPGAATLEGGDVLVLSERCIAVGVSERTHPTAVEALATALFDGGEVTEVIVVDLPKGRSTMHLDTVLTMVDRDAVVIWPPALHLLAAYRIRPGSNGHLRVDQAPGLLGALAGGLGVDDLRVVTTGEDAVAADREQWDDGNNTLAIAPGHVIAYERNIDTNRRLVDAGIRVELLPSSELPRGRGGPRCMSNPVLRDPLD